MKKYIETWSYWLAVISALIALVMRAFNALGMFLPGTVIQGSTILYMSFYKGAVLFTLINIATAMRIRAEMQVKRRLRAPDAGVSDSPTVKKYRTVAAGGPSTV